MGWKWILCVEDEGIFFFVLRLKKGIWNSDGISIRGISFTNWIHFMHRGAWLSGTSEGLMEDQIIGYYFSNLLCCIFTAHICLWNGVYIYSWNWRIFSVFFAALAPVQPPLRLSPELVINLLSLPSESANWWLWQRNIMQSMCAGSNVQFVSIIHLNSQNSHWYTTLHLVGL